jgi:oligopeptide transport system substrate-binding protein
MSYAIDRETICSSVLKDGSVAAEGIIPQQLATGPDGKDYRESTGKLVSYDAAQG